MATSNMKPEQLESLVHKWQKLKVRKEKYESFRSQGTVQLILIPFLCMQLYCHQLVCCCFRASGWPHFQGKVLNDGLIYIHWILHAWAHCSLTLSCIMCNDTAMFSETLHTWLPKQYMPTFNYIYNTRVCNNNESFAVLSWTNSRCSLILTLD